MIFRVKKCSDCDVIMIGETDLHTDYIGGARFDEQIYLDLEKNIKVPIEGSDKIIKKGPRRVKARVCPVCGKVELYIYLNN